jgi:hypothetical protein
MDLWSRRVFMTRPALFAALAALTGACAVAGPAYAPMSRGPTSVIANNNNFTDRIIVAHNRERVAVGVPPLIWDPALEAGAANYARGLALTGTFTHSRRASRVGLGENLWMGTRGGFTLEQMIATWISEKRRFVPGIFPRVSTTGNWADVGHYSQMIWPATTRLGCALAPGRAADYLVCRYAPAGNIDGRRVP